MENPSIKIIYNGCTWQEYDASRRGAPDGILYRESENPKREIIEIHGSGVNAPEAYINFGYNFGKAALWTKKNVKILSNIREFTGDDGKFCCYLGAAYDK